MENKKFPIPDWSKEEFDKLFQRASQGDKISQELYETLYRKNILPELEEIMNEED